MADDVAVSTGSRAAGYPCPKDGTLLTLIDGDGPDLGAWCPECHTVWRQNDEVGLGDLDALPESED